MLRNNEDVQGFCRFLLVVEILQLLVAGVNVLFVIVTLWGYQRIIGDGFRQFMN